jgi:hypothetical protein
MPSSATKEGGQMPGTDRSEETHLEKAPLWVGLDELGGEVPRAPAPRPLTSGWVRVFDVSGERHRAADIGTGEGRGLVASGASGVWVAHAWGRTLTRLEPSDLSIASVFRLRKTPAAIALSGDTAWVICTNGWLWRARQADGEIEGVKRLGRGARSLASCTSSVWALRGSGELTRIASDCGEIVLEARLGRKASQIVAREDVVWALADNGCRLLGVDPDTGEIEREKRLPGSGVAAILDGDTLWVACRNTRKGGGNRRKGTVYALDARTGDLIDGWRLAGRPRAVAAGLNAIWIACTRPGEKEDGTIQRVDESGSLRVAVGWTRWPIDDLAVCGPRLFATMSRFQTPGGVGVDGALIGPGF